MTFYRLLNWYSNMTKGNYEKEKRFQRQVQVTMAKEERKPGIKIFPIRSQDTHNE